MNPIPQNLRHLEALFDHYNVDAKGHFLGESSSFCLNCKPALPLLSTTSDVIATTTTAASSIADASILHNNLSNSPHSTLSTTPALGLHPSISGQGRSNKSTREAPSISASDNNYTSTLNSSSHDGNVLSTQSISDIISDVSSSLPRVHLNPGPRLSQGTPTSDSTTNKSLLQSSPVKKTVNSPSTVNATVYGDPDFPVVAQSNAVLSQFPKPNLARELIELFLAKVNRFVPIVPTLFLDEYDAGVPQSPLLLLAIFSIASKYSSDPMCRSDPLRAQTAGETYCKAACRLVDEFMDSPRLSTVQALFLLGKHLEESKNQGVFTKSFMYIGMAVRMAMDMGLNRNCSGWGLDPIMVEYRNRTWWFLYVYDRAQSSCYGRPYLIQDQDCGADKPKPDPSSRDPEQDLMDLELFTNAIPIFTVLGRVMSNFYPTNTSGSNFNYSIHKAYNIDSLKRGGGNEAVDSGASFLELSSSATTTAQGPRKKFRTTGKSRPKLNDQDMSQESLFGGDDNNLTPGPGPGTGSMSDPIARSQAHQEMLARQFIANQKQDAIVAELDKDLTEWVQALPTHLQWNALETKPNVYGDILHGVYYAVLILLHRPSIRVGELMSARPYSEQPNTDSNRSKEGCHSMAVCALAASRITKLAERCQNITHLERFGAGAFILLHAARIHLMLAAVPTPPRKSGSEGPGEEFIEAIRKKEQAVDQFHRSLGSLRKFSIYHWTVDGIGLSIRSLERTLAAILQEQEIDHEQEMERQRQKLLEYDAIFFDQDRDTSMTNLSESPHDTTSIHAITSEENDVGDTKPEKGSLHERAYYESMRLLELRLLYRERHHYTEDNHLEQHLQRQDSRSLLKPGMDLTHRRGLLDAAVPAMSHRSVLQQNISDLFDKVAVSQSGRTDGATATGTATGASTAGAPELVIRTYKPNTSGKIRRRGTSNSMSSNSNGTLHKSRSNTAPSRSLDISIKTLSSNQADPLSLDYSEPATNTTEVSCQDVKVSLKTEAPDMARSMSGSLSYPLHEIWPGSGLHAVEGSQTQHQPHIHQIQQLNSAVMLNTPPVDQSLVPNVTTAMMPDIASDDQRIDRGAHLSTNQPQ
ncbi:hypothetical protein BGZ49_006624, partial [Haplosporangium sp. Z 27]